MATNVLYCGYNEVDAMMEHVGIRYLKDNLSKYVARAHQGDIILVTDHGVPVARLAPIEEANDASLRALADRLGNGWRGGKPVGTSANRMVELPVERSLSRAILEDRESR